MATQTLTRTMFEEMRETLFGIGSEYVEVAPGYGVNVIQLTVEGALALAEQIDNQSADKTKSRMATYVAACCVDDEGNQVFTREDVLRLPESIGAKLFAATMRTNAVINPEVAEEAEKN